MKLYLTQIEPPPQVILGQLKGKGWDPVHHPMRTIRFQHTRSIDNLTNYAALILTSKNGARWFLQQALPKPWPRLAVVGEATASLFASEACRFLCEPVINGSELAEQIRNYLAPPAPLLFLCGARVAPGLLSGLSGYRIQVEAVYESLRIESNIREISPAGMVYFQAPSSVEDFFDIHGFRPKWIAAIGSTTGRALRRRGWQVDFQPSRPELSTFANELPEPSRFRTTSN